MRTISYLKKKQDKRKESIDFSPIDERTNCDCNVVILIKGIAYTPVKIPYTNTTCYKSE